MTKNKILHFRDLKENWDTYGAETIHPEAINLALALEKILPNFCVVPKSDGGIQFEKCAKDFDVEIEITIFENEAQADD